MRCPTSATGITISYPLCPGRCQARSARLANLSQLTGLFVQKVSCEKIGASPRKRAHQEAICDGVAVAAMAVQWVRPDIRRLASRATAVVVAAMVVRWVRLTISRSMCYFPGWSQWPPWLCGGCDCLSVLLVRREKTPRCRFTPDGQPLCAAGL